MQEWSVEFDNAKRRAGVCYFNKKVISFSLEYIKKANFLDKKDTLLHEIAHALVGPKNGHNKIWRQKAIEIGCSAEVYNKFEFSKAKWIKYCENHCWQTTCFRRNKNLICKKCLSRVKYRFNE